MRPRGWWRRPTPPQSPDLNRQHYRDDEPTRIEVPTRLDPLTGDVLETVYADDAAAAAQWDERRWRDTP